MDRSRLTGYLFGVLTAVCWAISPIFIRKGLDGLPSPLWGVLVGLTSATSLYLLSLIVRRQAWPWGQWDRTVKVAIGFQALAGALSALGQIGRTMAIDLAPVVVAIPLTQTTSLFTLIFAPLLLGRKVERVTFKLALGAVCVVIGSALVIFGQNS
jgi:drug/metabolite transporter (DMT)-like permease